MFFGSKWNPDGLVRAEWPLFAAEIHDLQHCYVTGGSTGLGLSFSLILVKKGAHVSIVARNQEKLNKALSELEVGPGKIRIQVIHTAAGCPTKFKPNPKSIFLLNEYCSGVCCRTYCCL